MRTYENISPWLIRRRKGIQNPVNRLIIFSYAGSSPSSFYAWANEVDVNTEVILINLPGRGNRMNDTLLYDLTSIVDELHSEIIQLPNLPTVYLGYSLGSLIAYELCYKILDHTKLPDLLVVAAGSAPHKISKRAKVYDLKEDIFWDKVKSYGGLPEEILREPELMKFIEPILRADFEVIDRFCYQTRELLSIPLVAIAGSNDQVCPSAYVKEWESHSNLESHYHEFNGGHFFINDFGNELHELLDSYVKKYVTNSI